MKNVEIWNEDCITGSANIPDESVDLIICDPPFGIEESKFGKHYNRKDDKIIEGYVEAPKDYDKFTFEWMQRCKNIMKKDATMYIISGWSNLHSIYKAIEKLDLVVINHIIWKYNFGVSTKSKWVSSHYHIFYISKRGAKVKFIKNAYFSQDEKDASGRSLQYADMEDVWVINKEYSKDKQKNMNKLPTKLVEKMINYSSERGDLVCDFFMGNFTTADCSIRLGRRVIGFEKNTNSYQYWFPKVKEIEFGKDYLAPKEDNIYNNQGKRISEQERQQILKTFSELTGTKKDRIKNLSEKFGRGNFSILNIIKQG